ncbi:hypothetical protein V8F20_012090 [Naviculisporaceae sp. PSN 640]
MSIDTIEKALGLDPVHIAVFQGDLKKLKDLVSGGTEVDQRSRTLHMTALHFAVILRRYRIACFLIKNGGNLEAQDKQGRTPADYNKKKLGGKYLAQFKKMGFQHDVSVGKESSKLSSLFRTPVAMRYLLKRYQHALSKTVMYLNRKQVVITTKVARVTLPELAKDSTHGFVAGAEDNIPKAFAISGWKYSMPTKNLLPNGTFTQLVRDISRYLGFRLPEQLGDTPGMAKAAPEDVGRYMACHVEKQLGVYWVLLLLMRYRNTTDYRCLGELKAGNLHSNEATARIFIDHKPCGNCLGFLTALEKETGVKFVVQPVPFAVRGNRGSGRCPNCQCDACTRRPPPSQARVATPVEIPEEEGDGDEVTREELAPLRSLIPLPRTPIQAVNRGRIHTTSPPTPWVQFAPNVAKPVARGVTAEEFYAATDSSSQLPSSGIVPISTINNHYSAYFASPSVEPAHSSGHPTPSPPSQAGGSPAEVVESARASSPLRAEGSLAGAEEVPQLPIVEIYEPSIGWHATSTSKDPSGTSPRPKTTIEESRKRLNLSRFSLGGTVTSTMTPARRRKPGRPKGSKNKKPSRATVRKAVVAREKSAFAQAYRFHQKQNQRSRSHSHFPF